MKLPLLYISGPITGVPNFRENFDEAATILRQSGYRVVNPCRIEPVELGSGFEHEEKWIKYMRGDLAAMMRCGGVAMLDGHETSKGAHLERRIAFELQMPIMRVEQWVALA